jgi:putative hydrolase of the HAD superfamily
MAMPAAVLLDLDNTLYPYRPSHDAGLLAFGREWKRRGLGSIEDGMEQYKSGRAVVQARVRNVAAEHNRLLYTQWAVEERTGRCDSRSVLDCDAAYWRAFLNSMHMYPGARAWLRSLGRSGTPVVLVSDMVARITHRKMLKLGLDRLVSRLVTSEEAGVEKPSPMPFLLALEKLGMTPCQNICMVGDSLERDVEPALRMGMSAVLINAWQGAEAMVSSAPGAGYRVVGDFRDFSKVVGWP